MHGKLSHLALHDDLELVLLSHVLIVLVLQVHQVRLELHIQVTTYDEFTVKVFCDLQAARQLGRLILESLPIVNIICSVLRRG